MTHPTCLIAVIISAISSFFLGSNHVRIKVLRHLTAMIPDTKTHDELHLIDRVRNIL